jgi:multicomponent Na+:H+ antiporter subunit G
MDTVTAADVIASVALIAGAALSLAAGVAVLRFPDTPSRIHAATKPQVLGIVLLMIGLGIRLGTPAVIGDLVLIVVLQFLTAPVSAHLAVRAAHRRSDATGPAPAAPDTAASDTVASDAVASDSVASDSAVGTDEPERPA